MIIVYQFIVYQFNSLCNNSLLLLLFYRFQFSILPLGSIPCGYSISCPQHHLKKTYQKPFSRGLRQEALNRALPIEAESEMTLSKSEF